MVALGPSTARGIIAFCREIQPLQWVRLVTALGWLYFFLAWLKSPNVGTFAVDTLRRVLLLSHLAVVTGCDESLLVNFAAAEVGLLGRRQCAVGALVYAAHLLHAVTALTAEDPISDDTLTISASLFVAASLFDTGIFHSARPADIFKLLIGTHTALSGGTAEGVGAITVVQIAALYFWSGISKFGGYFWGWVFQFQFLAMAPISYHLRSLYLDSNGAPRRWSTWFGFAGVLGEAAAGAAMLAPVATIRELAVYYAMAMHAFIVIFGIGPYRWNFVQAYFALCAARLCDSGVVHDDAVLPSPLSRMCDGPCLGLAVVLATSVAVPIIGAIDPKFLGRWLGGFRSAMFHFAGNERHTFYLIRKAAVEAAEHRAASCDADTNEVSSTRKLLRSRMDEAAEKGGAKFTNDPEFINFPMWVDGFDIRGPVKEAAEQLVPKSQVSNFEESHFVVPIPFMRTFGICLYTKDDESIPSVHRWYSNLVLNVLRADGGQVDPGDVLLFGVDPLALAELACARLRYKSWDATDLGSGCKARGKGLIVWR